MVTRHGTMPLFLNTIKPTADERGWDLYKKGPTRSWSCNAGCWRLSVFIRGSEDGLDHDRGPMTPSLRDVGTP